jgi:hypothetical protein
MNKTYLEGYDKNNVLRFSIPFINGIAYLPIGVICGKGWTFKLREGK